MANKEIELKSVIVLTVLTIVSAIVLTFVHQITAPIIEEQAMAELENSIFNVLEEAEDYEIIEDGEITYYQAFDSESNEVGIAIEASSSGYEDDVEILAGLDMTAEQVLKLSILNHSETPGLGARIEEDDFLEQFKNRDFADDGVDVITGATESSTAVNNALLEAIEKAQEAYGGE